MSKKSRVNPEPLEFQRILFEMKGMATPAQAVELLYQPIPVAVISADGTILAWNALAAWLCGEPVGESRLSQNVYDLSADFINSNRVPVSCNHDFRIRKLGALRTADPSRSWPAHRKLDDAVKRAEQVYRDKQCSVTACVSASKEAKDVFWRYSLCIRDPRSWPDGDPDSLMSFQVTDAILSSKHAPKRIPDAEKRFVVVFEPTTDEVINRLSREQVELKKSLASVISVTPNLIPADLENYIDFCVCNALELVMSEYMNNFSSHEEKRSLGTFIRELRLRQGYTAEELAQSLGVSRTTVSHWELGRRNPPGTAFFARSLVDVLNPTASERDTIFKLVLGADLHLEPDLGQLDLYEEMIRRTDRLQRIGKQIVSLQEEFDLELSVLRSTLQERYVTQRTPDEDHRDAKIVKSAGESSSD